MPLVWGVAWTSGFLKTSQEILKFKEGVKLGKSRAPGIHLDLSDSLPYQIPGLGNHVSSFKDGI